MATLTPAGRRALRARAHALSPVVMVSGEGLTPNVLAEIERSLKSHELIKIRVLGEDRERRAGLLDEICARTGASAVQHIGKILVIFRENPPPPPPARVRKPPARAGRAPSPRSSPARGKGRRAKRAG